MCTIFCALRFSSCTRRVAGLIQPYTALYSPIQPSFTHSSHTIYEQHVAHPHTHPLNQPPTHTHTRTHTHTHTRTHIHIHIHIHTHTRTRTHTHTHKDMSHAHTHRYARGDKGGEHFIFQPLLAHPSFERALLFSF